MESRIIDRTVPVPVTCAGTASAEFLREVIECAAIRKCQIEADNSHGMFHNSRLIGSSKAISRMHIP